MTLKITERVKLALLKYAGMRNALYLHNYKANQRSFLAARHASHVIAFCTRCCFVDGNYWMGVTFMVPLV